MLFSLPRLLMVEVKVGRINIFLMVHELSPVLKFICQ